MESRCVAQSAIPSATATATAIWRIRWEKIIASAVIGLYWVHHHFSGAIYRTTGHWFLIATVVFLGAIGFIAKGIALDENAQGMDATTPHIVFSVSKSICGALGGVLADKGLLDPDAPITDYVPEVAASVYGSGGCTVPLDMPAAMNIMATNISMVELPYTMCGR